MKTVLLFGVVIIAIQFTAYPQEQNQATNAPVQAATTTVPVLGKSTENQFVVKERTLGQLRSDYVDGSLAFAHDGSHFAYICGPQGRQQMIVGDSPGAVVVFCSVPRFSPMSNDLYYVAITGAPDQLKVSLIAGGKTIPTDFTPGTGYFVFSDDGRHYSAVGGKQFGGGQNVKPDGETVIMDGKVIGAYKKVSAPVFSSDGTHYAFISLNDDDTMSVWVDAKIQQSFKTPEVPCAGIYAWIESEMHFMPNGSLSYLVRDEHGWSIYLDDKRLASYGVISYVNSYSVFTMGYDAKYTNKLSGGSLSDRYAKDTQIMLDSFTAARNAPIISWWARSFGVKDEWRILVNGKPVDKYVWLHSTVRNPPKLSSDGKHIAYSAAQPSASDSGNYLVHDGNKYGPYDSIWAVAISDDGSHVAYAAKATKDSKLWYAYMDGNKLDEPFTSLYGTQFAAESSEVAWTGERDGKSFAVVNGIPVASGDARLFGPVFGVDGNPKWILRRGNDLVEITATRH